MFNPPFEIPYASVGKEPYDHEELNDLIAYVRRISRSEWTARYKAGGVICAFGRKVHLEVEEIKKLLGYEVYEVEIVLQPWIDGPVFPLKLRFFAKKGEAFIGVEILSCVLFPLPAPSSLTNLPPARPHPSAPQADRRSEKASRLAQAFHLVRLLPPPPTSLSDAWRTGCFDRRCVRLQSPSSFSTRSSVRLDDGRSRTLGGGVYDPVSLEELARSGGVRFLARQAEGRAPARTSLLTRGAQELQCAVL